MRKGLLGLMLAVTTALPAMAAAQDAPDPRLERARGGWRHEGDRQQPQPRFERQQQADQPQQQRGWNGGNREDRAGADQWRQQRQTREDNQAQRQAQLEQQTRAEQQVRTEQQARFEQQGQRRQQGGWQQWRSDEARRDGSRFNRDGRANRDFGNQWQGRNNRDGTDRSFGRSDDSQQWQRGYNERRNDGRNDRFAQQGQWNRGWRSNDRYDYRDYRSSNRGAFRLPRYYAPGGWDGGYRRFSIGIRLSSVLFGENYWIDDPYDYRLPPAYGPYRWVRYYNDALLVDIRSGYVVDTVYDIFW